MVLPKVLQNFQKTPKCTCWPKELNQKGFPRNIQYWTRPKGPSFRHCATFFKKNFFPHENPPFRVHLFGTVRLFSKKTFSPTKTPPSIFWSFATEWMLKNPKGSSLSVFSALRDFFSKIFFHNSSPNSPILGNFEVLLLFLSLGYGADLSRSRLL